MFNGKSQLFTDRPPDNIIFFIDLISAVLRISSESLLEHNRRASPLPVAFQMTGLGILPPPAQVWGDQQNPEHVAELISTMKTLMRKYESGAGGHRPSPLLPPPGPLPAQRKPPVLLPLTKRRRLLGDLLPETEATDEGPAVKRPRAGLGLLPHPGEPPAPPGAPPMPIGGSRRTLLGPAPTAPRKTLLGEKPSEAPSSGPPAGASYNKKVLFPTGLTKPADSEASELSVGLPYPRNFNSRQEN